MAIFQTKIGSTSRISEVKPLCLVKGFPEEVPHCIEFYHNYLQKTDYTILTIAWSSGFVQHFPIIDKEIQSEQMKCMLANATYANNTFTVADELQTSIYSSFTC